MIVTEDCLNAGLSAALATMIQEEVFESLDYPVVRLAGLDVPIPYNRTLERGAVPSVNSICAAVRRTLGIDSPGEEMENG